MKKIHYTLFIIRYIETKKKHDIHLSMLGMGIKSIDWLFVKKNKKKNKAFPFFFLFFFTLGPKSETEGFIQSIIWFDFGNSSVQWWSWCSLSPIRIFEVQLLPALPNLTGPDEWRSVHSPSHFDLHLPNAFYRLFTKWIFEINIEEFGYTLPPPPLTFHYELQVSAVNFWVDC